MIVRRGAAEIGADVTDEIVELIARRAGGDARNALNILELASQTAMAEGQSLDLSRSKMPPASGRSSTTRAATRTTTSSRRSSSRCAARIPTRPSTTSRRCSRRRRSALHRPADDRARSEDIGLADPQALVVAVAAAQAVEHVGLPEARLNLAEAAIYLALAPKSNAVIKALGEAAKDVRELGHTRPPDEPATRTTTARSSSAAARYIYPHLTPRVRGRLPARAAEGEEVLSRVQSSEEKGDADGDGEDSARSLGRTLAEGRGHQPWQRRRHGSSGDLKPTAPRAEGTSPEELIAAAHASCILMALAGGLARAQTPPTRLESEAKATFEQVGEGFALRRSS